MSASSQTDSALSTDPPGRTTPDEERVARVEALAAQLLRDNDCENFYGLLDFSRAVVDALSYRPPGLGPACTVVDMRLMSLKEIESADRKLQRYRGALERIGAALGLDSVPVDDWLRDDGEGLT